MSDEPKKLVGAKFAYPKAIQVYAFRRADLAPTSM